MLQELIQKEMKVKSGSFTAQKIKFDFSKINLTLSENNDKITNIKFFTENKPIESKTFFDNSDDLTVIIIDDYFDNGWKLKIVQWKIFELRIMYENIN